MVTDVNVNLGPGAPVLVPLPLESWRRVKMTVRLGKCICEAFTKTGLHHPRCHRAHPIEVTCLIGGKDWASSEVIDAEIPRPGGGSLFTAFPGDLAPLRARWALVKALVLGSTEIRWYVPATRALFEQRDVVFAALCEMARAERSAHAAFLALPMDLRKSSIIYRAAGSAASGSPEARHSSAVILEHYVERLIEQVWDLTT